MLYGTGSFCALTLGESQEPRSQSSCEMIYRGATVKSIHYLVALAPILHASLALAANDPCADSRNLKLTNGKIVTMDRNNSVVSSVTIQNGVFDNASKPAPCTKTIDLHGRTVIP